MRGAPWTSAELARFRKLYPIMRTRDLLEHFPGRTYKALHAASKNHGITKEKQRRRWTEAELRVLRTRYPDEPTKQLAADMDRTITEVYQKAIKIGLRKSEAYLASPAACRLRRPLNGRHPGAANWFPKGHVPANKGTRRPGWSAGRMRETQFKKGQMSGAAQHNYVPIGTEKLCKDGYLVRKVTDDPSIFPARRWVGVHRLVWEAAHGQIPPGHAVAFKDGKVTNVREEITLDRLELVTRAEMMRRNSYHTRYPKEVALAIQARGALNRVINKRAKA